MNALAYYAERVRYMDQLDDDHRAGQHPPLSVPDCGRCAHRAGFVPLRLSHWFFQLPPTRGFRAVRMNRFGDTTPTAD